MPCNSDYLAASNKEIALSQVACLLDEIDGATINPNHWRGYHPAVYNQTVDGDALVASLCEKLQSLDATDFSLEMQIWWRDHQEADKARLRRELQLAQEQGEREAAIQKLTPHERKLLGVECDEYPPPPSGEWN